MILNQNLHLLKLFTGTVAFGSAIQGWGFTITTFANLYNYFDPKTKKWKSKPEDDEGNEVFE